MYIEAIHKRPNGPFSNSKKSKTGTYIEMGFEMLLGSK